MVECVGLTVSAPCIFASVRVWEMALVVCPRRCARSLRGNSDVVEAFAGLVTTGLTAWN